LLDLTPTLLGLVLGDPLSADNLPFSFTGMNLAPMIAGDGKIPRRPIRYVTFSGKKAVAPSWLSWLWVPKDDRMALKIGQTEGVRKFIWSPADQKLSVFDLGDDPLEVDPDVFSKRDRTYKREVALLERWFEATNLEDHETQLSERDTEILRSLGYVR
jgi:hypothetical protein